ncbi:formate/nitrite transporter family protein [Propionispora vibrioides]|uniref:Hydrosulfide channel, FNT family n=1 Tax=Propionispora vibrioides TaxID=112903 RepID=A0A1H8XX73_9FIRM|nr:formate/nitrite transporter family protein [Propionispora vibrioides]SEP43888.1 hydrosulfide channel, FNT family [Propionispora vibrioides]
MYYEEIAKISGAAEAKAALLKAAKGRYILSSALAGMYVGFGILLIFTIGGLLSQAQAASVKLIMGLSFGIALSLVIMAGSELFTGNNLVMAIGRLEKRVTVREVWSIYLFSFAGNLLGSIVLAGLFAYSGLLSGSTEAFIVKTAQAKMSLPWLQLFIRGILCNALVCLAIWCSFRMKEETGKLIMVFWCLFAFITSGFEHSVANMTLLTAALLAPGAAGVSVGGFIYNIVWVTLGNVIGGALVIGYSYWYIARKN